MLENLAEEVGVSVSTVSRALSGKPGVSAAKRERITALAKARGYVPDSAASLLRTGARAGLAVVSRRGQSEIQHVRDSLIFGLGRERYGSVRVIVHNPDDDLDQQLRGLAAEKVAAIIMHGIRSASIGEETVDLMRSCGVGVVTIDGPDPRFDSVTINRAAGTYQAARMFLLCGCRAPLFFSSCGMSRPDERLTGIIAAYLSLNRRPEEIQLVKIPSGGYQAGEQQVRELVRTREFDGLFCYNDHRAVGALRGLWQEGVAVPEACRVVGFDNLPVCAHLPVSITTVSQPGKAMVESALDLLARRRENPDAKIEERCFPAELILRESAPVKKAELRRKVFDTGELEQILRERMPSAQTENISNISA